MTKDPYVHLLADIKGFVFVLAVVVANLVEVLFVLPQKFIKSRFVIFLTSANQRPRNVHSSTSFALLY